MKSHQGMKKRIRKTAGGKLKIRKAGQSHLLTKKSARKKQLFNQNYSLAKADQKQVKRMIAKT